MNTTQLINELRNRQHDRPIDRAIMLQAADEIEDAIDALAEIDEMTAHVLPDADGENHGSVIDRVKAVMEAFNAYVPATRAIANELQMFDLEDVTYGDIVTAIAQREDKARELERELAEANKTIQLSRDKWNADAHRAARLEWQLAEAMRCVNALSKQADDEERSKECNAMLVDRYRNERDEARECLREMLLASRESGNIRTAKSVGKIYTIEDADGRMNRWRKAAGLD